MEYFKIGIRDILAGDFDPLNADLRIALVDNAWTPDKVTPTTWGDISANEITGDGYTAGGIALTTKAITDVNDTTYKLNADNPVWAAGAGGISARYAVLLRYNSGTPANSIPIGYEDLNPGGGNQTRTDANFEVDFQNEVLRLVEP